MVCLTLLHTCCATVGSIKCSLDEESLSLLEGAVLYLEYEEENASEKNELSIILDHLVSVKFIFIKENVLTTLGLTVMGRKQW